MNLYTLHCELFLEPDKDGNLVLTEFKEFTELLIAELMKLTVIRENRPEGREKKFC
jgi:hypothetical protein